MRFYLRHPQRLQMKATGEKEGIKFSYGGMIANTMDSHRIMTLAWKSGGSKLQNAVCDSLMQFYFEEEGNLGDRKALTAAAVRGGLPDAAVTSLLEGDDFEAEVASEATDFQRRYRISGVPFFIVDGKMAVSGAQEADVLAEAFEQIAEKKA